MVTYLFIDEQGQPLNLYETRSNPDDISVPNPKIFHFKNKPAVDKAIFTPGNKFNVIKSNGTYYVPIRNAIVNTGSNTFSVTYKKVVRGGRHKSKRKRTRRKKYTQRRR